MEATLNAVAAIDSLIIKREKVRCRFSAILFEINALRFIGDKTTFVKYAIQICFYFKQIVVRLKVIFEYKTINKIVMKIKMPLLFFLLFLICFSVEAQREPDQTFMPSIQGIKLFVQGNQISYPIIRLGRTQVLELDFDDLDANIKSYNYSFILCNSNWQPADMSPFDYISGFTQGRLGQYRMSSVSKTKYVHYQALLPESSSMPTQSGNYLLMVFLNGDTSQLAFTRRVLIATDAVPIAVQVQQPFNSNYFRTTQKVQFSIDVSKLNLINQQQQLKVVVLQNYRWDNAKTGLQPLFMRGNQYEYNGEQDCLFPAGKEYRWADLRSYRFLSDRIDSVNVNQIPASVYLYPDPERTQERILNLQDLDGFFEIATTDANNPWWQGDYANVHFTFFPKDNQPFQNKNVYLLGQLTQNKIDKNSMLTYNSARGVYETTLLLKQGYYSYTYVTREMNDLKGKATATQTDGDYWETENVYTVLVYYQSFSDRHESLVGVATINSRTNKSFF